MRAALLDCDEALAAALAALAHREPTIRSLLADGIRPPLRKREPGLPGLLSIVVSQQISTASAAAIWARVGAELAPLTPAAISAAPEEAFRRAGLSAPKIRAFRSIAAAVLDGSLPLDSLHELEADAAHARLVAVGGIGPWTADIYLMFCLGHPDAFAAGDLALQEAARLIYGLESRPDARGLSALAEAWRPWRGVAARLLWAYYRRTKGREGVPDA